MSERFAGAVNFEYKRGEVDYTEGYVLKTKFFRCSHVKFPTRYRYPEKGTETVEIYHFEPREEPVGSVVILHGLGTKNIAFLLWLASHMANAGVRSTVPILPGNFTRTAHGSTSGKDFFSSDVERTLRFWEHAVVDTMSSVDFLKQRGYWHDNNCLVGYCLGGMLSVIVGALNKELFKQMIIIAAGGDMAELMWHSPTLAFVRKEFQRGGGREHSLDDERLLKQIFLNDIQQLGSFESVYEMLNSSIHPLLKVDPVAYARFVDRSRITMLEALFDRSLPPRSRRILWETLGRPKRYFIPAGHVTWLPFQFFIGNFILKKMNIKELKRRIKLMQKPKVEK